jgi:predicted nucleic acid-binding protein
VILLDSNVLSALMRPDAEPRVVAWLDDQPSESIWTTSVNVYELRFGIELLSTGRRREALQGSLERLFGTVLENRVLSFDAAAAELSAGIAARQRRAGRPLEIRDVQIAGIALVRKAILATRSTQHFTETGVLLVDPWSP